MGPILIRFNSVEDYLTKGIGEIKLINTIFAIQFAIPCRMRSGMPVLKENPLIAGGFAPVIEIKKERNYRYERNCEYQRVERSDRL